MCRLLRNFGLLFALFQISESTQVVNCTFTRYAFGYPIPDFTYCMFTQTLFGDQFNWGLANAATSTPGTGPDVDHTGDLGGHFAYIDSSMKVNGSHAQLSSPSYTKSSSDSGGCVQFYYHMHGADIGTLSMFVYDNTQAGVVATFERTGSQGNQWLRADMNLNLPAGQELQMQVVINAYTSGANYGDNTGDIAIDDIIIDTDGQCSDISETPPTTAVPPTTSSAAPASSSPTATTQRPSWSCDFDGLMSPYCGITKFSYGAGFTLASRGFRSTTGPSFDHTKGNGGGGKFLYMQGLGVRPNKSAVAETPQFDQTYYCFKFWYHMFGSGVGQLKISADVDGLSQEIWSQTGDRGNKWYEGSALLPTGSVKVIITAVRGDNSDSDIAIDDVSLSTTNCQGATITSMSTAAPTTPSTVPAQPPLLIGCNFDSDKCNLYRDSSATIEWQRHNGPTYNSDTGPSNDHTQGTFAGHYMYINSNYKTSGSKARVQTGLMAVTSGSRACLRFSYHMNGTDMGTLNVRLGYPPATPTTIFTKSGSQGTDWKVASVDITFSQNQVYLEFEGTIEHSYTGFHTVKGDIAIDDIILAQGIQCSSLGIDRVQSPVTVATTTVATTEGSTVTTTTPTSTPTPPTTTPWTTPTTTPSPIVTCTFDNSALCGYSQERDDQFDWVRANTKLWSGDTGPAYDHTTGNGTGYFMYIRASYKNSGSVARLASLPYFKLSSNTACLTFWYHMWGTNTDMGSLKVTLRKGFFPPVEVFSKSGNQGNRWISQSVNLDLSSALDFQIVFEGVIQHNHDDGHLNVVLGDIAIDDIVIDRLSSCSNIPSTNPTSTNPPTKPPVSQQTASTALPPSFTAPPTTSTTTTISTITPTTKTSGKDSGSSKPISTVKQTAKPTPGGNVGKAQGQTAEKEKKGLSKGGVAGIVVSLVIVVLVVAMAFAVVFMRKRQIWLFAPGNKMSVMFSRSTPEETGYIYDKFSNEDSTTQPNLVINGFNSQITTNGFHNPNSVESTDA